MAYQLRSFIMAQFFSFLGFILLLIVAVALQGFSLAYGGAIEASLTNSIGWISLFLAFAAGGIVVAFVSGK
jgi:hypothetical protein